MPTEELPSYPQLPPPPAEKLNPHFILGEIRDYIRDFKELFPLVDIDVLREQTTAVRRKQVEAETQIRQFLKAFRRTETFKEAFGLLDQESQKKVHAFPEGKSPQEVTQAGFELPPSPAPAQELVATDGTSDAPVIHEDDNNQKVMKVRIFCAPNPDFE
ncbi:MAG: hypothetical protein Q9197_002901 [Variospora fuerteventurae]